MRIVCFGDSITARKEGYPSPALTYTLGSKKEEGLNLSILAFLGTRRSKQGCVSGQDVCKRPDMA